MKDKEILDKLTYIIKRYMEEEFDDQKIEMNANLIDDLKINSANLVDIILDVEDAFDIEIDDSSAEEMLTVGRSIEVIKKKLEDGGK